MQYLFRYFVEGSFVAGVVGSQDVFLSVVVNDIEVGRTAALIDHVYLIGTVFISQNETFTVHSADTGNKAGPAAESRADERMGEIDLVEV